MVLLLAGFVAGCGSTQTAPDSNYAEPHKVTIDEACGTPQRWPISQECLNMLSLGINQSQIALLQQKSDLLMAVWRSCPSASPCKAVSDATLACHPLTDQSRKACREAQEADYSCRALENDPIYAQRNHAVSKCMKQMFNDPACADPDPNEKEGSKAWVAALNRSEGCWDRCFRVAPTIYGSDDNTECSQARAELADFDDQVKKAMLDAHLKAAFAPPQPIMVPYQPPPTVIIQQPTRTPAFPTQTTCMPFGPGVTCNSR